jgi:MoaA/NifB/PqqE/SkfB family radical SAM enzyme
MDCTEKKWLSNSEYLKEFNKKSVQLRIPLSGSLDLTHRCNLKCVHCYLGDRSNRMLKNELSTNQIVSVIDQVTESGCLYFLITGGEPLLREDFPEIYSHAKNKGLLVTVFTNGTLIKDSILQLFHDLPPHIVEISLYGATASTYEHITGVSGSYEKCIYGVKRLLDHNIHVRLKTILMTANKHEFFNIEHIAKEFGVRFRFDAEIFPCINGNKSPLSLRVPPEDVIRLEFSLKDRLKSWKEYFERTQGYSLSDSLYNCGATNGHFLTGWRDVLSTITDKKAGNLLNCNQCEKRHLCGFCPAFFELENGLEHVRSEYLCALGNHRFQFIHNDDIINTIKGTVHG